jgi:hypothetical protein
MTTGDSNSGEQADTTDDIARFGNRITSSPQQPIGQSPFVIQSLVIDGTSCLSCQDSDLRKTLCEIGNSIDLRFI